MYIKVKQSGVVELGGNYADADMLASGWVEYTGSVPQKGATFVMVDGELMATSNLPDHVGDVAS